MQGIDFCIDTNGENHHTQKFNLMTRTVDRCLVVRRGQAFKLDILLNRPYDASRDGVSFIFYVAGVYGRSTTDLFDLNFCLDEISEIDINYVLKSKSSACELILRLLTG